MYAVTALAEAAWERLARQVTRRMGARERSRIVIRTEEDLEDLWRDPGLLLGQACGYPLMQRLHGAVRVVAIPEFGFPGCSGPNHRSVVVVRADDTRCRLAEFRDAVAACNGHDSNSGMNLLRHSVAALAREGRFFREVHITGSHTAGLARVAAGQADLVAVDCVTFGYLARDEPWRLRGLRVLQATASSPALPFITAADTPPERSEALLITLRHVLEADATLRERLAIVRLHAPSAADYRRVLELEQAAGRAGYASLA